MPNPLPILAFLTLCQTPGATEPPPRPSTSPPKATADPVDSFHADPGWKSLGKDIWFDPAARRVIFRGKVALQEGVLEHLICRKGTKEHESVLSTEAPPKLIQAGLLLTGASPGHPVRFQPAFEAPAGTPMRVFVEWEDKGKAIKLDAREWVKDQATNEPLRRDWVFAGSELFEDPRTKAMIFAADDGDLFTVANFPASILDLPFRSSANDADRAYVANTEKIPTRGTLVTVTVEPVPAKDLPADKAERGTSPKS